MPGWMKHENFVPDKTNRAFDLQLMKTSKAKDVSNIFLESKKKKYQGVKNHFGGSITSRVSRKLGLIHAKWVYLRSRR